MRPGLARGATRALVALICAATLCLSQVPAVASGGQVHTAAASSGGAAAAGANFQIVVKPDGTLWAWGGNHYGQLGVGDNVDRTTPTQVGHENTWKTVAAGYGFVLAVKTDGTLWAWGVNGDGELGLGDHANRSVPAQVGGASDWKSVAAGEFDSFAVKGNGDLYSWGWNGDGELGLGDQSPRPTPTRVAALPDVVSVAGGYGHMLAVDKDGHAWACGNNSNGQLGDATTTPSLAPVKVDNATDWKSVAAGVYHSVGLKKDGTVWCWGYNWYGQVGDNGMSDSYVPKKVGADTDWTSVGASAYSTYAVKTGGTAFAWGDNYLGELGTGNTTGQRLPAVLVGSNWKTVVGGMDGAIATKTDGSVWNWGSNSYAELGTGSPVGRTGPIRIGTAADWKTICAGGMTSSTQIGHVLALKKDGTLWAWGSNLYGQCGAGGGSGYAVYLPTQIGANYGFTDPNAIGTPIAAGGYHSLAINNAGKLFSWGANDYGQRGQGGPGNVYVPTQVDNGTWDSVGAGDYHSLGVKGWSAGTGGLYAWGRNDHGQLGLGSTTSTMTPLKVTPWSSPIGTCTIDGGNAHSVMVLAAVGAPGSSGYAWGQGSYGQLGHGNWLDVTSQGGSVLPGSSWTKAISAGGYHTAAVLADGTLHTFGYNGNGELGLGTWVDQNTPQQVGSATNWRTVSAGGRHTVALKTDGTLWAFGLNLHGQLGNGSSNDTNTPVQVGTDHDWAAVSCGNYFTIALKTDGSLWGWGESGSGELGFKPYRETPAQIIARSVGYYSLAGVNRYGTAIAASRSAFATGACDAVVLATGRNYPDALGASGLAGAAGCPVLLVDGMATKLDVTVRAEIDRLTQGEASRTVYIAGGTGAVSAGIQSALETAYGKPHVLRLAGTDRYTTAELVAKRAVVVYGAKAVSWPHKVIVATGADYHDALLAGPIAYRAHMPILLVGTSLDSGFKPTLTAMGATAAMIVGSTTSVRPAVMTAIGTALGGAGHVTRPASQTNAYSQALAVANLEVSTYGFAWDGVGLATGENYPDALGAGPVMGVVGAPLLFTHTLSLDAAVASALTTHKGAIAHVRFFGGTGAVSQAVRNAVANALK